MKYFLNKPMCILREGKRERERYLDNYKLYAILNCVCVYIIYLRTEKEQMKPQNGKNQ